MASTLRGGKTAPRLLEDLRLYNPQRLPNSQFNVLTSLPPPYNGKSQPRKTAKTACVHDWKLKPNQTSTSGFSSDERGEQREVSAFCALCRCHLKLRLSVPNSDWAALPCPQQNAPLHHFRYNLPESGGLRATSIESMERWEAHEKFQCTLEHCGVELDVFMSSPRLTDDFVHILTDPDLIEKRAKAAISTDPTRFEGVAVPLPVQVLSTLRSYINNSLINTDHSQKINAQNKRFLLCLGDECGGLLSYLTFEREGDFWIPPQPALAPAVPFENPTNVLLDDVLKELIVIMSLQEEQQRRVLRNDYAMVAATNDFHRLLGCLIYETSPAARRQTNTDENEHPFYPGLGAVINFHDKLLSFAYDRQLLLDPENSPYYLQCLQGIAKGRGSEELHTKAAIEESSGRVSLDDIKSAYTALGLDPSVTMDEETVIGTFKSRVSDAPRQEEELRRCLRIVGEHMNSQRIEDFAADSVHTYEQALAWLGATAEMGDDFITSMYSLKVNENANNEKMANHCILIIADHRDSNSLRGWLSSGILHLSEMEPAAALEYLVPGNHDAEDDFVISCYTAALNDTPSQKPELDRALRAIAKYRNSSLLLSMSGGLITDQPGAAHDPAEWPTGLENIGNTCYLNSLLQFFFTIKPLRELVLYNEEYLMEINDATVRKKQAGSRKVTRWEIERAQQFIKELAVLFHEMIVTRKSQIVPKLELARLTMLSTSGEATLRRASVLNDARPDLSSLNTENNIEGTNLGSENVVVESPLVEMKSELDQNAGSPPRETDRSSETTLVDVPAEDMMDIDTEKSQVKLRENKENVSPGQTAAKQDTTANGAESAQEKTAVGSDKDTKSSISAAMNAATENDMDWGETINVASAPDRAPPVPPRVQPERRTTIGEEEVYRQQDVTEVIGNVLFQLQCAIKPEEIDDSGEQLDLIKRLFYGRMKTTTTDAAGKPRPMIEFFSDLKININSGPSDLYGALDSLFDQRMVKLGSSDQQHEEAQFSTLLTLPSVLQIHPIRTAFDPERGTAYKLDHHFAFDEIIYLDRYMDGGDLEKQKKRAECWAMKDNLTRIEERYIQLGKNRLGLTARETLLLTADYLKQIKEATGSEILPDVEPDLISKVQQAADDARVELARLSTEAERLRTALNAAWSDPSFQTIPYQLHAVFIHRGMVASGHYWIYIYDHPGRIWRKYNDGYVEKVVDPAKEIFGKQPGDRPATPMFFVYVKQSEAGDLVEVVRRELPPEQGELQRAATAKVGEDQMDGTHTGTLGKGLTWCPMFQPSPNFRQREQFDPLPYLGSDSENSDSTGSVSSDCFRSMGVFGIGNEAPSSNRHQLNGTLTASNFRIGQSNSQTSQETADRARKLLDACTPLVILKPKFPIRHRARRGNPVEP